MSSESLSTYFNDHLAGSVVALELLDYLAETAATSEARQFFTTLRREVTEDQQTLQELLQRMGATESRLRKASAWLTEKFGELKLRFHDAKQDGLQQLEALETLGLGILGKLALWNTLETVRDEFAEVRELDLARLQQRAREQYDKVESRRLEAARMAFSGPAKGNS